MLSNFDKRQIILIKNQLLLLKQDKISLYRFVENLESLLNILEKVDRNWISRVYQYWSEIETILAWALHKKNEAIDESDAKNLMNLLNQIEQLTEDLIIQNNFSLPNENEINNS
jgi:hypothetical protein